MGTDPIFLIWMMTSQIVTSSTEKPGSDPESGDEANAALGTRSSRVVFRYQAFDGVEHHGELLVVLLLHCLDLARELAIGIHQAAKLDEGAHDGDVHLDCARGAEHAREHDDALLGEGIRQVDAAAVFYQTHHRWYRVA